MDLNPEICYRAVRSRDSRFDGRFFTAVTSTGIYCRPVCPARTPRRKNVAFYPCAAAAEEAGFRPCLRCRPESSPGTPAWLGTSATVSRGLKLINEGALDQGGVDELAGRLGMGSRQLRRLFNEHLGASPLAVALSKRVHMARKLLDETRLTVTEIAYAAGFQSVRRFNAAMQKTYGRSPTSLRKMDRVLDSDEAHLVLRLPYRAPYDWRLLIDFLKPRAIPGVETVRHEAYRREIEQGVVEVKPSRKEHCLLLRVPVAASRNLASIVERARCLFDVGADPDAIERHLKTNPLLAGRIKPGLRVPGAWDRFELAVRAVLGQQVSVKGATTLAGRVNASFGLSPAALARADLTTIGLTRKRAEAVRGLATAARCLDDPATARERLLEIPGIGPWTVQYIAMRALKEPDAFPSSDLGLRKALSKTAKQLEKAAEKWRPWRAYAAMHLWMGS